MRKTLKMNMIAAAVLAACFMAGPDRAVADEVVVDQGDTVVVTHHPVVTHRIDESAWHMCLDHHGDYSVNGCYISDRNERIRMMEEENYSFKYRAHEAGFTTGIEDLV